MQAFFKKFRSAPNLNQNNVVTAVLSRFFSNKMPRGWGTATATFFQIRRRPIDSADSKSNLVPNNLAYFAAENQTDLQTALQFSPLSAIGRPIPTQPALHQARVTLHQLLSPNHLGPGPKSSYSHISSLLVSLAPGCSSANSLFGGLTAPRIRSPTKYKTSFVPSPINPLPMPASVGCHAHGPAWACPTGYPLWL